MKIIADLHIHSHFSRATSKKLDFEHLTEWAMRKGVNVVGTGDIAHPGWLQEMRDKLEPAEDGLFRLKPDLLRAVKQIVPKACHAEVRFLLAGEISNIYKKYDKVRKIHNVVFLPSLAAVEKFQAALEKIGNIRSDGRPILGLDSRDLLEIVLETDPRGYFIPAHIWTPWFAMFGSKSGFDKIEDCFNDLTPHIFAVETGLSSDPPMNWRLSALDKYTLVSNSDAHSPQKLAREANVFDTELSYDALFDALKTGDPQKFLGTIEFFPEEGKYHYDGHRKCEIRWDPATTKAHDGVCPVCGKPVTVGVMHRVDELADRPEGYQPKDRPPFFSLIPLPEVISEVVKVGPNSKRVQGEYEKLLSKLGSELFILQDAPLEDIAKAGGARLAEGIANMRRGDVHIAAGYDGEFGTIKLFDFAQTSGKPEMDLFGEAKREERSAKSEGREARGKGRGEKAEERKVKGEKRGAKGERAQVQIAASPILTVAGSIPDGGANGKTILKNLNDAQLAAARCTDAPLIITAGPGTGKTRTLTQRMAFLIAEKSVAPENLLAITFTNKAAQEMRSRLENLTGKAVAGRMNILTFHALGAQILREQAGRIGISPSFSILNERDQNLLMQQLFPQWGVRKSSRYLRQISEAKNGLLSPDDAQNRSEFSEPPDFVRVYRAYENALRQTQSLDFDDLIFRTIQLFRENAEILQQYRQQFRWISVDEYQDVNYGQYCLLRQLAGGGENLCVIGDPDQAIYGFRGADRAYFLKFPEDFSGAKRISLAQNYRSTQSILNASTQVISRDAGSRENLWSEIVSKTRLEIYQAPTGKAEAEYVVHSIEKMVGGTSHFSMNSGRVDDDGSGRSFGDFAVLYRLGNQAELLEEAFLRSGMPYQTVGQQPFFDQPVVRLLLSHLRFLQNPSPLYFQEMFGEPRPTPVSGLFTTANVPDDTPLFGRLHAFADAHRLINAQRKHVDLLADFLEKLNAQKQQQISVAKLLEMGCDFANNSDLFAGKIDDELQRKLIRRASPFKNNLTEFLEAAALQKESDEYDPRADRVPLMTIHASKGLEFPVVFIVGCEETLIPYRRYGYKADVDEERRLFYVGMTRAQEKLVLTHTKSRMIFGEKRQNPPSRFIGDIEAALKEIKEAEVRKKKKKGTPPDDGQLSLF